MKLSKNIMGYFNLHPIFRNFHFLELFKQKLDNTIIYILLCTISQSHLLIMILNLEFSHKHTIITPPSLILIEVRWGQFCPCLRVFLGNSGDILLGVSGRDATDIQWVEAQQILLNTLRYTTMHTAQRCTTVFVASYNKDYPV